MKFSYSILFFCFSFFLFHDSSSQDLQASKSEEALIWKSLKKESGFKKVFKKYKKYRLEIIYTQINRELNGDINLKNFHLGDSLSYFYPASTVKLPTAIAISEMLQKAPFYNISMNMKLKMDSTSYCNHVYSNTHFDYYRIQKGDSWKSISKKYRISIFDFIQWNNLDTTISPVPNNVVKIYHRPIRPSINDLISSMLVYSDNDAYNKLFEVVGGTYFSDWFARYGFEKSNVSRKFLSCEGEEMFTSVSYDILNDRDVIIYHGNEKNWKSVNNFSVPGIKVGKGYFYNGNWIKKPRDFSDHNRIVLSDLHEMLQRLVFPSHFSNEKIFQMDANTHKFIIRKLGQYPSEDLNPLDSSGQNWEDGRNIYLFNGDDSASIGSRFRWINIIGQAYGFSTDCMYFTDDQTKTEFFLSVRIYTNKDEILGDDQYEYKEIAMPLMKFLGEYFFQLEQDRSKEVVPNFALFRNIFD